MMAGADDRGIVTEEGCCCREVRSKGAGRRAGGQANVGPDCCNPVSPNPNAGWVLLYTT